MRDVILTPYFTGYTDWQRHNQQWRADPAKLQPLIRSMRPGRDHLVILHDCFPPTTRWRCEAHRVDPAPKSPYLYRWTVAAQYLRDHDDVRSAWIVDATDVRRLHDPFPLKPDTLYLGWVPETISSEAWLADHMPKTVEAKQWAEDHRHHMLLNPGTVGGDKKTLLEFITRLDAQVAPADADHEVFWANVIGYESPNLITGPEVCTVFKAFQTSHPRAIWKHK